MGGTSDVKLISQKYHLHEILKKLKFQQFKVRHTKFAIMAEFVDPEAA